MLIAALKTAAVDKVNKLQELMKRAMIALKDSVLEKQWLEEWRKQQQMSSEQALKLQTEALKAIKDGIATMLKSAKESMVEFAKNYWQDMKSVVQRLREELGRLQGEIKRVSEEIVKIKNEMRDVGIRIIEVGEEFKAGAQALIDRSSALPEQKVEASILVSQHQLKVVEFAKLATPDQDNVSLMQEYATKLSQETDKVGDRLKTLLGLEKEVDELVELLKNAVHAEVHEYVQLVDKLDAKEKELQAFRDQVEGTEQQIRLLDNIQQELSPQLNNQREEKTAPTLRV